ncbi:hypothetical protein LRI_0176 [Limosilactobacillus reuteri I5007]|uniref:Uncharacterized protein n=4 Tax=Limosilactobacillus reuteri TaxID=1598 RepID=A0A0U5FHJ0_LIMRT|nr:hypothetical protein LRI_0176 [Limosilactobacillus reuteri I5007]EEI09087.1 hypothetical protein HMPREF0535_1149 [Limosilactobacillus reuteri MM2-3]EGC14719.1 hypothetical protein HMPREF0536_11856 [Limosilactobacillus reuteri MM4-1A]CCC03714.1 conserved hypothetical protein [Limosilactobacillus reuteri subsp. suis]CUR37731.1 FIG00744707: hypothetical protein [Limosilactobacillus reuteri]
MTPCQSLDKNYNTAISANFAIVALYLRLDLIANYIHLHMK